MTRKTIHIEQEIERHDRGQFSALVIITDEEVVLSKEFTYYKANITFSIYKSLITILREYKNVDVVFKTNRDYIIEEINKVYESQGTLAKILADVLTKNGITIKAVK